MNSNSDNEYSTNERSILSVVFFDKQVQIHEQDSIGASAKNYNHFVANDNVDSANYFTDLNNFFKSSIGKNWNKVFAIIPCENFLLIPSIFYTKSEKENLYSAAKLSFSGELKDVKPVNTDSHLLFSFNHKLEMFLHNNFPGIEIFSDVHWLINHLMLKTDANYILAFIDNDDLKLLVKKENKLQLCNAYKATNTEELVYFMAYALQSIWPEKHQQLEINLMCSNLNIDSDLLWQYYPNTRINDSSKQATMLQLLSECV